MNDKTGGAAFPQLHRDPWSKITALGGLTMLDYFAGQALNSLLISWDPKEQDKSDVAADAYAFANWMLAEKRKRESEVDE